MKLLKNHIWLTTITIAVLDILIFLILIKKNEHDSFGMLSTFIEMGIALLVQSGIGIIAVIPAEIRKYGQGTLFGTLVMALIWLVMFRFS